MEIKLNGNGELTLSVPGKPGHRGHDLIIPASVEGLKVITQILRADRAERAAGRIPSFATSAAPTQEMVRQYLRVHAPKIPVKIPTKKTQLVAVDVTALELDLEI